MYRKEIFTAPGVIEIKKYHAYRLGGKKTRRANEKQTEEAAAKVNFKNSKENLYRILATNFTEGDYRIDLTYRDPPPEPEEAIRRVRNYVKALQRLYKKHGEELKYLYVTEYKGHRIHHHLIVNQGTVPIREVKEKWKWSDINYRSFRFYDGSPNDARALAEYFVKEMEGSVRDRIQKTRWAASKNLKKPNVKKTTIYSRHWREKPKPPKGYYLQEVENAFTSEGYPYQWARFLKEMRSP